MKRPGCWYFLKAVMWVFAAFFVLLMFVLPLLTNLLIATGNFPIKLAKYFDLIQSAQTYVLNGLGYLWVFFLGSCFASFLNVVAWRVPRGRSINGSSHCPQCDVKLRFSDNLPVIGWLRNQGQCRNCQLPIPIRYLLVEIFLGVVFLLIAVVEVLSGGINLPLRPVENLIGFEHLVFAPKWHLLQIWVFQMTLICFLFTFSLIRREGLKIPVSIFGIGLAFGIILPIFWPAMLVASWNPLQFEYSIMDSLSVDQLLTLGLGGLIGLGTGWMLSPKQEIEIETASGFQTNRWTTTGSLASLCLIGIFLGWQSSIVVAVISSILFLGCRILKLDENRDQVLAEQYLVRKTKEEKQMRAANPLAMINPSFFEKRRPEPAFLNSVRGTQNFSLIILLATVIHILTWRFSGCLPLMPPHLLTLVQIPISIVLLLALSFQVNKKGETAEAVQIDNFG
jgi:prepilin signal peptidase PulO-like enzyme (type II secretory pathway)